MPISTSMRRTAQATPAPAPQSYNWDTGVAVSAGVGGVGGVDVSVQLTGAIVIALVAAVVVMSMKWPMA